jgi:hypothetical protein
MMSKLMMVAFLAVSVLGCASNSGVVSMGQDTYFVSRQATTGFTGMGTLKAEALGEAGQFCGAKGRKLQLLSESDAKPPFILGNFPKTEIKVACV